MWGPCCMPWRQRPACEASRDPGFTAPPQRELVMLEGPEIWVCISLQRQCSCWASAAIAMEDQLRRGGVHGTHEQLALVVSSGQCWRQLPEW